MLSIWQTVLSDIQNWLTRSPDEFSSSAWSVSEQINNGLLGIAYGLLLLFFLMTFFKTVSDFKSLTLQQVVGWLMRFFIAKVVLDVSMLILQTILGLSLEANSIIIEGFGADIDWGSAAGLKESATSAGLEWNNNILSVLLQFFQSIPQFLLVCIMWLVIVVSGIIMTVVVYMRFFKVYIYTALAPIPLSFFGHPELKQTGVHFLKAYGAICLEICVIGISLVIFSRLATDNSMIFESWNTMFAVDDSSITAAAQQFWNDSINYLLSLLIKVILLVTAVLSANKIIKEIIGV